MGKNILSHASLMTIFKQFSIKTAFFTALISVAGGSAVASNSIIAGQSSIVPVVNLILDDGSTGGPVIPPTDPNLIANSGFEVNNEGWFAFGPMSVVVDVTTEQAFAGTQSLKTSGRMNTFEGPATDITSVVTGGERYTLSAYVRTSSAMATNVSATMKSTCMAGDDFSNIATVSADNSDWVEISATFTLLDCSATKYELYFEGPAGGVDIFLDEVSLEVAPALPNLLTNGDFETGVAPWFPFDPAMIATTTDEAFSGSQSLITTGRTATFQGPALNLVSELTQGTTYNVSARVRISGMPAPMPATVEATVNAKCPMEVFLSAGSVTANSTDWSLITGSFTVPSCTATELLFYFQGPSAGVNILIDDVSITEAP